MEAAIIFIIVCKTCSISRRRLISKGTGDLEKANCLHNQKGSPKGVFENREGAEVIVFK